MIYFDIPLDNSMTLCSMCMTKLLSRLPTPMQQKN